LRNDCTPAAAREHVIDEVVHIEDGVADHNFRGHGIEDNLAVVEVENAGRGRMSVSAEELYGEVEVGCDRPPSVGLTRI